MCLWCHGVGMWRGVCRVGWVCGEGGRGRCEETREDGGVRVLVLFTSIQLPSEILF